MNRNVLIVIVVLMLLVGGVWAASSRNKAVAPTVPLGETGTPETNTLKTSSVPAASPAVSSGSVTVGTVKIIEVTAQNYSFTPKEITVKKGDKVTIKFTNTEGSHNWVLDEFDAQTSVIGAGKTEEVTFTADKIGTFEYYCSVGSHRTLGMKGNLIVE